MGSAMCCFRKDKCAEMNLLGDEERRPVDLTALQLSSPERAKLEKFDTKVKQVVSSLVESREHARVLSEENARLEEEVAALKSENHVLTKTLSMKREIDMMREDS
mmetsp:Transcript_79518/g.211092  ORF Transcript_79518/g.211092 Transcript_79518/m.211092 type:complete len:105 (-) Transcript_79518:19-333(-)